MRREIRQKAYREPQERDIEKALRSNHGPMEIEVPRDRDGEFEPELKSRATDSGKELLDE